MAGVTKKAIAEAFLQAAQQKPIDKVTVKDVVGICGITRQTFYYHFQDLLAVLEWLMAQRVESLLAETLAAKTPNEAIRVMLSTIEEKPDIVMQIMTSHKREDAPQRQPATDQICQRSGDGADVLFQRHRRCAHRRQPQTERGSRSARRPAAAAP